MTAPATAPQPEESPETSRFWASVADAAAARWPRLLGATPTGALVVSTFGGIGLSRGVGWPFWAGAGLVLIAMLAQLARQGVARRKAQGDAAEAAQIFDRAVAQQDVMSDLLAEVARSAAAMVGLPKADRTAQFLRLAQQVVDAARAAYSDVPGLRSVIYSLDGLETSLQVEVHATVGHRDPPNPLLAGTERGDGAVELVRSGRHLFVERVSDAPEQWKGSGVGYDTFLSIPIRSTAANYGLLTVDAPISGEITPAIVATWRLAAAVMANVFAIRDGSSGQR